MKTQMKIKALLLAVLASLASVSQATDITKLVQDTQRFAQNEKSIDLVWWIPNDFWRESLKQNPELGEEETRQFLEALEDYNAFVVIHADIGVFGGMTPHSREQIAANIALTVNGRVRSPLANEVLKSDAANFYSMMKPMLSQMLGQMGQGMEFFIYSNIEGEDVLIDPKKAGSFTFTCYQNNFEWRLPLGSLLPPKVDPETGDVFPGNYNYNPFTGKQLAESK